MYNESLLAQNEICALNLFKFHATQGKSHRFYYQSPKFGHHLHKLPLIVDIGRSGGSYPK